MKKSFIRPILLGVFLFLSISSCISKNEYEPTFPLGEFVRPAGGNPVLLPDTSSKFFCPIREQ
jgi:hypothetical protein